MVEYTTKNYLDLLEVSLKHIRDKPISMPPKDKRELEYHLFAFSQLVYALYEMLDEKMKNEGRVQDQKEVTQFFEHKAIEREIGGCCPL